MPELLVNDTTGKMAMITGNTCPAVDFGRKVKGVVKALMEVCPDEYFMAGVTN